MADIKKPEEELIPKVPVKPGYQSQWSTQISDIMGRIQERKPFQYDFNADALYNQYKDRYIQQGKLAMEDTMGQAAALTGGYGNSYAQNAGQQAYHGYLQGLNDKIPEIYQLAMDKYAREGSALMEQYGLLTDRDNAEYGRFQDAAALAQSQINAMIAKGIRPSQELIDQAGVSQEYIDAMVPVRHAGGGGYDGGSGGAGRGGGSKAAGNGMTVEEIYMGAKKSGASSGELDKYLKSEIAAGNISQKAASDLREKRW